MKFDIIGMSDSYGSHRFSNNIILQMLSDNSVAHDGLKFVWWIEKIFLDNKFEKDRDILEKNSWFGVAHVPLLTPKWAMYSQNDLSRLMYSDAWFKAKSTCKGIICLSEHLAEQYRALLPEVPIYSLKHPMGQTGSTFSVNRFFEERKIVMVGTWLRNFQSFLNADLSYRKVVLHTKYGRSFIREQYARYNPSIHKNLKNVENIDFLSDEAYDELLSSSILFLGMHETSANNAVCESIMNSTPFISLRHPAVEEYVGEEYPLFIDSYEELKNLDDEKVVAAHQYLKERDHLREALSYEKFIDDFKKIYNRFGND